MTTKSRKIGFDRKIALEWLDAVAAQVARNVNEAELREYLWRLLEGSASGATSDGARRKTITVLKGIWFNVPADLVGVRDRALALLLRTEPTQRIAVHWAMTMASYPFFACVAETIGRMFAVQGDCSAAQVVSRMRALWGDRELVNRTTRHVVRSMVQWGVLDEAGMIGAYRPPKSVLKVSDSVGLLLVEAVLLSDGRSAVAVGELLNHPALFPFVVHLDTRKFHGILQFEVQREGLDQDLVRLARTGSEGLESQMKLRL